MTAGTGLVRYDAMVNAIAEAYTVDEVKDIHDKARAAEVYAKQAKNFEAERQVCEVRLRAERKAGQLLAMMEKAKGIRLNGKDESGSFRRSDHTTAEKTLDEMGISKQQSSSWQRLANVPEDDFEAALSGPKKPSTTGIIKASEKPKSERVDDDVLWLWGTLRDFERHNVLIKTGGDILDRTPEFMREELLRLAPIVGAWLNGVAS